MTLGLVIPVRNDQTALNWLLEQARTMQIFDQVVVVDDGSEVPVNLPDMGALSSHLIRHEQSQGPGPARNAGLEMLEASHVLFFDSDDLMTPELCWLWRDLWDRDFDFCLFRHCDTRQVSQGHWGLTDHDAAFWRRAGMGGRSLFSVDIPARAALAQTANFPWNKIWRTDALRRFDIHFANTPLHEDILPHWMGFIKADTILASDRVAAIHHVATDGARLTNQKGAERLAVFDVLQEVQMHLQAGPPERATLLLAFWQFAEMLLGWVHANLDPGWHADLVQRQARFWERAHATPQWVQLAADAPDLVARLEVQMEQKASC